MTLPFSYRGNQTPPPTTTVTMKQFYFQAECNNTYHTASQNLCNINGEYNMKVIPYVNADTLQPYSTYQSMTAKRMETHKHACLNCYFCQTISSLLPIAQEGHEVELCIGLTRSLQVLNTLYILV